MSKQWHNLFPKLMVSIYQSTSIWKISISLATYTSCKRNCTITTETPSALTDNQGKVMSSCTHAVWLTDDLWKVQRALSSRGSVIYLIMTQIKLRVMRSEVKIRSRRKWIIYLWEELYHSTLASSQSISMRASHVFVFQSSHLITWKQWAFLWHTGRRSGKQTQLFTVYQCIWYL